MPARPWSDLTHWSGFDWASEHHDVIVLDASGKIVADFRFDETGEGWAQFREQIKPFAALAVAIETSSGAAVERLLDAGLTVFPVNPKSAKCYRERHTSSGAKSDRGDALSLADALRVDGHGWRPLQPEDPLTQELRQLCRDENALIQQRTAFVNQLRQALHEYYPTALEAFDDWTSPSAWAFVEAFPTPQDLVQAGKRRWEKFLHAHKIYRPQTAEKRLACFARATEFCGSAPTTAAKSRLAVTLAKMLRTLHLAMKDYRARILELFEQHPDHDLFGSLPGAGEKIAPRLLGEIGTNRGRFEDSNSLQCYAGSAPVSFQTGKTRHANMRRACNKFLRQTVHFLSNLSRAECPWAAAYYSKKREQGKSHATALRCLGQRWLKIIWKMWQTRTPYDAELHQRNQIEHGSWVLQLLPEGASKSEAIGTV